MIEKRGQPFLDQRQPVIHPRKPAPLRNRMIQRIARGGRAKGFAVTAAETLDALFIEQGLGCRKQCELLDTPHGALVGRIESPDALDLVTEKIEAKRMAFARRKQIDQTAANGELARIRHCVAANIAVGLKHLRQLVAVDSRARLQLRRKLADSKGSQRALRNRIDRGDQQLRPGLGPLERSKAGQSLRRGAQ